MLSANVGEGLFFAGPNHVAMQVVASPEEHPFATSSPKEILAVKAKQETEAQQKGLPAETPAPAPTGPVIAPPAPTAPTAPPAPPTTTL